MLITNRNLRSRNVNVKGLGLHIFWFLKNNMYRETALQAKSLKNPSKIHVNPCKIVITWKCFEPKQNLVSARSTILQAAYLSESFHYILHLWTLIWLCIDCAGVLVGSRLTAHGGSLLIVDALLCVGCACSPKQNLFHGAPNFPTNSYRRNETSRLLLLASLA